MDVRIRTTLEAVPAADWNALAGEAGPFLRHEFLLALERHGALQPYGWDPHYLTVYEGTRLIGAAPLYAKDNSYGEFVFDWAWADAYRRSGLRYYPKLVAAVPYTPATGPRLLAAPGREAEVRAALSAAACEQAQRLDASSVHWLFAPPEETAELERQGLLIRLGCQFHWENRGYRDFQDLLDRFTAEKRKKVRRERRRVNEQGVELRCLHGDEVSDAEWHTFHRFYCDTFHRLGGTPTLSLGFFQELARTLPDSLVLVLAYHRGRCVAGALSLRSADVLYGRHWGCAADFDSLHFEACYYQGLDYCIAHGLRRFEPGAQGEHKIARGFLPVLTASAHWIAHPRFRTAIASFLERERRAMQEYATELERHSPYKR